MVVRTRTPRGSGGFSLDQAARLGRMNTRQARSALCPGCGAPCEVMAGAGPDAERMLIVRCPECGRGLVLDRPPAIDA